MPSYLSPEFQGMFSTCFYAMKPEQFAVENKTFKGKRGGAHKLAMLIKVFEYITPGCSENRQVQAIY